MKVLVIRADEGKLTSSEIIDGDYNAIAKEVVKRALEEWNPGESDLTAIRTKLELRYKLPIDPDLYDKIMDLNLELVREGNELIVNLPVLTISFDNAWLDDAYLDRRMYIVSIYLDDAAKQQLEEYAIEATKEPKRIDTGQSITLGEEELRRLEEGLTEIEEEKPKRRRSKRKKK
ncbi:hypothetical protein Pyrde_1052 [Pyrodictium delaneyi]|uniref:DUF2286 domain-containing protein n=1 Tax=Pyrodictium delaneyi TaxID=1273541 RepID=A0A0P0N3Y2_9CREN|nr:DUF2286 domain-containing protein [Pyrodictium delaneyi]ALL01100.1 hypothetical protein Pyrde_1052 [Pyrodictium delaneyi]OWJ55319.1 hypothetical protein Pdsh_00390 [Pyrodictium delaneyi]